jgi:hypothetical protein
LAGSDLYRDNTNNTMTTIIQVKYSISTPAGAPYGTGNGPTDTSHTGNMLNSYSRVELSQVAGEYKFTIQYKTNWTGQTEAQTGTLSLGIPGSTYWPTTQTINDVSITTTGLVPFNFSCEPTAPPSVQTVSTVPTGGCRSDSAGTTNSTTFTQVIAFYINFNNGTSTRVAIAIQNRWEGPNTIPYTLVYNRTRIEVANGSTASPGPTTLSVNSVPIP